MKKKFLAWALILALVVGICPVVSAADSDFVIEGGVLTQYKGAGGDVVIPDGVQVIGDLAFDGMEAMTSVTFPSSLKKIGAGAFWNCTALTYVSIPESVTSIGALAFCDCTNLADAYIPATVTMEGRGAFKGTALLNNQGDFAVTGSGYLVLYQGEGGDVVVPRGVTTIGGFSFADAKHLDADGEARDISFHSITLPDTVTAIGNNAFFDLWWASDSSSGRGYTITIPYSVSYFGEGAFDYIPGQAYENPVFSSLTIHGAPGSYAESYFKNNMVEVRDGEFLGLAYLDFVPDQPRSASSQQPAQEVAHPSTQSVLVDGKPVEFQMYALKDADGNDTNYVKVRDVAHVLNGTAAQFSVAWNNGVSLVSGQGYEDNGSEMSTPFSGQRAYAVATSSTTVNGSDVMLHAIILNDDAGGGYTYYKLRDLGKTLGFNVGWSAETGVFVETGRPYDTNG